MTRRIVSISIPIVCAAVGAAMEHWGWPAGYALSLLCVGLLIGFAVSRCPHADMLRERDAADVLYLCCAQCGFKVRAMARDEDDRVRVSTKPEWTKSDGRERMAPKKAPRPVSMRLAKVSRTR